MTNKQLFLAKRGLGFALCFLAVGGIRGGDVSKFGD